MPVQGMSMTGCLSLPCDYLVTCPGCSPTFAPRQLGQAAAATSNDGWMAEWMYGRKNGWMDGRSYVTAPVLNTALLLNSELMVFL